MEHRVDQSEAAGGGGCGNTRHLIGQSVLMAEEWKRDFLCFVLMILEQTEIKLTLLLLYWIHWQRNGIIVTEKFNKVNINTVKVTC